MSQSEILKNVYSFIEVLQTARTDQVKKWDKTALINAMQWAHYCEQVCQHCQGKSYGSVLSQQIAKLDELPWSLGELSVNMDMLSTASHHLKKSLLQNPFLPSSLFLLVLNDDPDNMLQLCCELSRAKYMAESGQRLLQQVVPSDGAATNKTVCVTTQANLLLQHLTSCFKKTCFTEKTRDHLAAKLKTLSEQDHGLQVLLRASVQNVNSVDEASVNNAHQLVLDVLLYLSQNPAKAKKLYSCNKDLLAGVSAKYFTFFTTYTQYLIQQVSKTQHIHHDSRDDKNYKDNLAQHFASLLKSEECVAKATTAILKSLGKQDSYWTLLANDLKRS